MIPAPQVDHLRTIPYAIANTFLGSAISQSFAGLYWLEKFLNAHQPKSIIELGTGPGTLTCLFGLHCPGGVSTYDLHDGPSGITGEAFSRLGVRYFKKDILNQSTAYEVMTGDNPPVDDENLPRFIFCDNGDKQLEFALYVPLMQEGDAIAVHDFGVEFHLTEAAQMLITKHNLIRYYDESTDDGSLIGFWVKGGLRPEAEELL